MANIYVTDATGNEIYTTVGYLKNSGSSFPVLKEPSKVTKFTAGNPSGIELTKNTSTPTSPSSGQWGYSNGYVYLGDALQTGETVIATCGTVRIFEGVTTLGGTSYFDVGQSDANYRTKQQKLYLHWVGGGEELRDVQISAEDFLSGEGSSADHYSLAPDNSGSPGTYTTALTSSQISGFAALTDGQKIPFWVKCVKPQGSATGTFSDVSLKITGTRYLYTRNSVLISGNTSIELPYNHYYLAVFYMYEIVSGNPSQFRPPIIYWNSSQQKTYLQVGFGAGSGTAYIHYIVCPLNNTQSLVATSAFAAYSNSPGCSEGGNKLTYTLVVDSPIYGVRYCSDVLNNVCIVLTSSTSGRFVYWTLPTTSLNYDYFGEKYFLTSSSSFSIQMTGFNYTLVHDYKNTYGSCDVYAPYVTSWGGTPTIQASATPNYIRFRGIVVQ